GLTRSQPCMGYCLNVMRGCLASVAEIDPLWRDFGIPGQPASVAYVLRGSGDKLCVGELASADSQACWNGADVVRSYTMRVVSNGIKGQSANPEVKVRGTDPVISQILDKLKHVNQLLQGKSIPRLGSLDQIEAGSGDWEGRASGDCDDEDGCSGSGGGQGWGKVPRVGKRKSTNPTC
ncbi:hypothetical protein CRUP_025136, partial [Coryphaenoides rupestris]